MAVYLLELGLEEIPAKMVTAAAEQLAEALVARLREEGLSPGAAQPYGGPRRLAAIVSGLAERQPDASERIVGPPADQAFGPDGAPTRAAEGFARKLGLPVTALERVETGRGTCVAGVRHTRGALAAEVIGRVVPEVVLQLGFPKTMRWGDRSERFVRPLHWIVSLLDEQMVPFTIAGIPAGATSSGHRFLGGGPVAIRNAGEYVERLAAEHVVVDSAERERRIAAGVEALAAKWGYEADLDAALLGEVAHFVEEPHVVLGHFSQAYLDVPEVVLVTSMKHHQKSFPMWLERGKKLGPAFAAVANVPDVEGHISRGFERVLNARLADARFFWNEDRKRSLVDRVPDLERVTVHEKLGSYAQKGRRLAILAPACVRFLGGSDSDVAIVTEAATLAKADLVTGMVGEFPELQGIMGGLYLAAREGGEGVARAVSEHYLPVSLEGRLPTTLAGRALSLADKLDSLVGSFGVGLQPTGTRDPFGLRRAAQGVVRIVLAGNQPGDLTSLLAVAAEAHSRCAGAGDAASELGSVASYLRERVEFVLRGERHRPDTLDAVLAVAPLDIVGVATRARALTVSRETPGFDEALTVLKRVANITRDSAGDSAFDVGRFEEPAEHALARALGTVEDRVRAALRERDYSLALERVRELAVPLHGFFEQVLVMAPEAATRENRLRLLRAIGGLVEPIGDLGRLQVERKA